jgi:hypothetical protein
MTLLSVKELSEELSVSTEFIKELIDKQVITPYGGRARLGEPRFSRSTLPALKKKIETFPAKK